MNDPDLCEAAIRDGKIDGVALGRAGLAESAYPQMLMRGRPDKIHPCIACGNCMSSSFSKGFRHMCRKPCRDASGSVPLSGRGQKKESPRSRRRSRAVWRLLGTAAGARPQRHSDGAVR